MRRSPSIARGSRSIPATRPDPSTGGRAVSSPPVDPLGSATTPVAGLSLTYREIMSDVVLHKVRLEPVGLEMEVEEGEIVLNAAFRQGIALMHGCKEGQPTTNGRRSTFFSVGRTSIATLKWNC